MDSMKPTNTIPLPNCPAISISDVWHKRTRPKEHSFENKITQIWIDPDKPNQLLDNHILWSHRKYMPASIRNSDYGTNENHSTGDDIRTLVKETTELETVGEIRMLTQPRMWGWLFNPITIYLLWNQENRLCASVLEVTNTPWKERHHYVFKLVTTDDKNWKASFEKKMHVSPFLGMNYKYEFALSVGQQNQYGFNLNLFDLKNPESEPIIKTRLETNFIEPTQKNLTKALRNNIFSTHRTSMGIHVQAAKLYIKKVPFVNHPSKEQKK